jgi:cytoskeletal protein RodZ
MDIGSELRRARTARGLSVLDVSEATRIRPALIEAIERNDFEACRGEVFARGHVRTIAAVLDLDPLPLLESMGASNAPSALEAVEPESLDIWELRSRANVPSETRTWAAIAITALIIVVGLIWHARANDAPPALDAEALPSVTNTATATVTPEATPTATAGASGAAETIVGGAIMLRLECADTSWVRITNADGTLYEGTMRAGDTRSVSSETDVTLRIGNAAGIALTVNDQDYGSLGVGGQVYTHTFRVG